MSSPQQPKLVFKKQVKYYIQYELTFEDFKEAFMQKEDGETDKQNDKRCLKVWNTMCKQGDKNGVVGLEVEEVMGDEDNECYEYIVEAVSNEVSNAS
jgi:hypothetical protein